MRLHMRAVVHERLDHCLLAFDSLGRAARVSKRVPVGWVNCPRGPAT
jgi:hypothetical protein